MLLTSLPKILDGAGFQISTICVCISCIYFTVIRSKPEKLQNKLFLAIVSNILITAACNVISAVAKQFAGESDLMFHFRTVSQYIYFLFHCFLAPLFCFYVAIVTSAHYKLRNKGHLVYELPVIFSFLLVLTNPLTHWVYYFADNKTFHRNWGEYVLYGVSVIYYLFAAVLVLFLWDAISATIKRELFFFFGIVALGAVLQLCFMPLHTELFAEAIAMTGIMVTIENEEGRRDSRTRIYNHAALSYDIQRYLKVRQSFFILCIKMQNPMGLMQLVGSANLERLTELTVDYLSTLVPRHSIYYIGIGTFVIVNENDDRDYNLKLARTIKERFDRTWNFQDRETKYDAAVFCAEIPMDLKTYKGIMMLINGPIPDRMRTNDIYYGNSLGYILRRSQVEEAIINGLENKSFEVFYQPIYNAADKTICAGEALLRLHDSNNGEIHPGEFLPIAERNGMIFELGDFVLDEVCKFLKSGIPTEMGIETLNVNLSVVQCIQPTYADRIIDMVSKYDIAPSKLAFEITESAATADFDSLKEFVAKLKAHGFRFTVDDYGIGYSNIHMMLLLDVDIIKIDRTLLWEAEQSEMGQVIMDSLVAMIKRMGKKILITGVENRLQIELVGKFGVDYLQGYYFSNPISQNEFIGILKATQLARFEEQKALAASEAMSNFLANMSHEIRTPINAVLGMDEMILRESDDKKIIEYARNIEGAGRTLLSLINDILDFSKIEAGNVEIVEHAYELSSLLSDVLNMIKLKADKKHLKLLVDVEPSTPENLYGDEIHLRQIIINLLNNAVKYTKQGSVALKVSYEKLDEKKMNLLVAVKDTGIGIREEDIDKLFEKFKRVDLDKTKTIEGSGLGLAITSQLLKHMNGTVKVESTYGKGSVFSISLPQKILEDVGIGNFDHRMESIKNYSKKDQEIFRAPDAKILVVDDTPMNLVVVRELLKRTGVMIDEAYSGAECLQYAADTRYDLIFLDYRMPEMDGIETRRRLKELEPNANKDTPVIAFTANAISGSREKFLNEGFDDYITKPIDGERLERLLLMYLPGDKIKIAEASEKHIPDNADQTEADPPDHVVDQTEADPPDGGEDTPLNTAEGIKNCGSEEAYQKVLRTFRDEIRNRAAMIRKALEEEDIKTYTIEVHAIKSSARIVGAQKLSEFARELEEAGDGNDLEKITAQTDEFLKLYESYEDTEIANETEQDNELPELSEEMWFDALNALKDFAHTMDYDNAVAVLESIKSYKLTEEMKESGHTIESLVYSLNWGELIQKIDELYA
ncbi:MAG: EAL domain-containing protein [Lachnospiraceae bacterium]|nr:EAL domain-containing protein [Lachnospiraceae bacterium]